MGDVSNPSALWDLLNTVSTYAPGVGIGMVLGFVISFAFISILNRS